MKKPKMQRGDRRRAAPGKKTVPAAPTALAEDLGDEEFERAARDKNVAETGDEADGAPSLVRLNKYLADHGIASRRVCDDLIAAGKVTVNGETSTELGRRIDPEKDRVEIDGVVLKPRGMRRRYYLLNKPSGVVCTNDARETRPRAVDLISDPYKGRIYTVGRLDEESRGLILLTNDGDFANRIMHPRFGIEKTYLVKVAGSIDDSALQHVRDGVHLSEGRTSGARILVDERGRDFSRLTLTIHEGMNREVRRVFARVGYKVTELVRIRIGPLHVRGLKPGRWRELLNSEVQALLRGSNEAGDDASEVLRRGRKRFPKKKGYARHVMGAGKHSRGGRDAGRGREGAARGAARGPGRDADRRGGPAKGRASGSHGRGPRIASGGPRAGGPRSKPAGRGSGRGWAGGSR